LRPELVIKLRGRLQGVSAMAQPISALQHFLHIIDGVAVVLQNIIRVFLIFSEYIFTILANLRGNRKTFET